MQLTSTLLSWILAHHVGLCSREVLTLKKGRKVNCRWQRAERAFWAWCIFDDQNYSNVLEGQLRSVWYSLQSFFQSFGDDCVSLLQRWMNTVNLFCSLMLCLVLTGSLASGYLPQKFPSTYLTQVHGGLLYLLRSEGKAMWPAETLTHWHHSESLVYYSCCGWVLPLFYFPVKANPCLPACVLCNMRSVTKYMEEKLNFAALLSASRYGFISYADGTVENIIWPRVFYIFSTFFIYFISDTAEKRFRAVLFRCLLYHHLYTMLSQALPFLVHFLFCPSLLRSLSYYIRFHLMFRTAIGAFHQKFNNSAGN